MEKYELCKEIGKWYGAFFEENGKLCIDNGQEVFQYDTADELLSDWVDTLIAEDNATGEDTWDDAVEFIYKEILKK